MLASEIPLKPVTNNSIRAGKAKELCDKLLGGNKPNTDPYNLNGSVVKALTGSCKEYNMAKQEDRDAYADLMARAVASVGAGSTNSPLVLWEERIKTPEGGLIIYLCYVEAVRAYDKYTH